ncbi:uncharacterized protein BX663DRAFT_526930 [Cokeromyces recurvatus]|uniref:uncharacterized protein n=1 Tax=Cokeromyces recurvatus TaxID=90255 RepID=UPI00221EB5D7|nr:uncharacterized protein BX663DRAFT_526930 [Cokeromyces recurvatus]KAI7897803.1 hypothetical protein BX663DRAFT_526930 [Cokeromyces recurvatus]
MYTDYFDDKNLKCFTTWCSRKKLHFFIAVEIRKKQKSENGVVEKRIRPLYILKQEFFAKTVSAITEYPLNNKLFLKNIEEEGRELTGYIRKSKGEEKDDVRVRLLEAMANRLTERCSIKTIYVSPFSNSMDEIASRDLCEKSKSFVRQVNNVSGSVQDMMNHLKTTSTDICLIVIDFAGLSRNCKDIRSFVRSHPKLKKKY